MNLTIIETRKQKRIRFKQSQKLEYELMLRNLKKRQTLMLIIEVSILVFMFTVFFLIMSEVGG